MTRLIDRLEMLDAAIINWTRATRKELKNRLKAELAMTLLRYNLEDRMRLGNEIARLKKQRKRPRSKDNRRLQSSIRAGVNKKDQEIERAYFTFPRHAIFLEQGVGFKRPVGSAKANASKVPWISPVLSEEIKELAEILAKEYADLIVAELRFLIPGIVDVKVS